MKNIDTIAEEVQKTLETVSRIKRVHANPYLADEVMRRLSERSDARLGFAPRVYRLAFAALFVLLVVNVFSVIEVRGRNEMNQAFHTNVIHELATEYQLTVSGYYY